MGTQNKVVSQHHVHQFYGAAQTHQQKTCETDLICLDESKSSSPGGFLCFIFNGFQVEVLLVQCIYWSDCIFCSQGNGDIDRG